MATAKNAEQIRRRAEELEEKIIADRRWLHQHPELSWKETGTTEFLAERLREMGIEPRFYEGHTGLWAVLEGGKSGPGARTILLRADMDALPIREENDIPYKSVHEGVMHACGHDSHMAMLLGGLRILSERRDELPGNVRILFQGGEETAIGAKYYVEQGILDGVDAVYGCHIAPWVNAPLLSANAGPRFAGTDEFAIQVEGKSCHGGMPQQGFDAVVAASAIVMNLQTVVSRRTDALDTLVVTVGVIRGGESYNVVSGHAELRGTVRTYSKEVQEGVPEKIRQVAENTAKAFGCTASLEYEKKTGPVVHTDPQMLRITHDAAVSLYGEEGVIDTRPTGGGDDFAYFLERVPGIYAFVGGANPALGCTYPLHHPRFNLDESVLKRGAAMFAQVTEDYLGADAE